MTSIHSQHIVIEDMGIHQQRTRKGKPENRNQKRRIRSEMTKAEQLLWQSLRGKQFGGLKFRRQHGIGQYIVDFYCPEKNLAIEVEGDVHALDRQIQKDRRKEEYLTSFGVQIGRYTNNDIFQNLDGVLEDLLLRFIQDSTSPPPLLTKEGKRQPPTLSHISRSFPFNSSRDPLPRSFFDRPTLRVAKDLLGKCVFRETSSGLIGARITDVEAYVGPQDRACHASKGRTKRTEVMFGPAGITYVYLIYGMYHCLNLVTERIDFPAAVLIRGIEVMQGESKELQAPTRIVGPGRVCRFLEIDRTLNQIDSTQGRVIWIEDRGETVERKQIQALPRVGVGYAGEWSTKPWRFCLVGTQKTTKVRPMKKRAPLKNEDFFVSARKHRAEDRSV